MQQIGVVVIQTALDEAGIRDGLKEAGEEAECRVPVPKDRPKVYGAVPGAITALSVFTPIVIL